MVNSRMKKSERYQTDGDPKHSKMKNSQESAMRKKRHFHSQQSEVCQKIAHLNQIEITCYHHNFYCPTASFNLRKQYFAITVAGRMFAELDYLNQ
jgi:hypothetical protein